MSTTRVATFAAILGGSLLGSLAAAVSVASRPPTPLPPPSAAPASPLALSALSRPAAPAASSSALPAPPVAASATGSGPVLETEGPLPDWLEHPLPADPKAVDQAALQCARGNPVECMRAGDAYDEGRGVDRDERAARLNRSAGARMFDESCKKRSPEACHALSVLYSLGHGVPRNLEVADGLVQRTRQLCVGSPSELCKNLPPFEE